MLVAAGLPGLNRLMGRVRLRTDTPTRPQAHVSSTPHPSCPVGGLLALLLFGQAKLGDEILDYRDLAALPKSKAIYNIDRPDMISYTPYISHSAGDRRGCSEVGLESSPAAPTLPTPSPLDWTLWPWNLA